MFARFAESEIGVTSHDCSQVSLAATVNPAPAVVKPVNAPPAFLVDPRESGDVTVGVIEFDVWIVPDVMSTCDGRA
jgi:hypothetical protein